MRIAIFTDTFHPMINGVVTAIRNIVEPLADRGHEFLIVTARIGQLEEYSYPGVRVLRLKSIPARFYEDFRWTSFFSYSTYKTLRDGSYDLVHFMTPFTVSYLGIKLARMLNLPVVGTFHTFISDPSYSEQLFKGFLKPSDRMAWRYLSLFYNSADFVTAPSPTTLRTMSENGIHTQGEVISNGIRLNKPESLRKMELSHNGSRTILYTGRLANEKNLFVLIEGFRRAWEHAPELQLLLVGDGPLKEDLQRLVGDGPIRNSIIFAGKVRHDELMASGIFESCWIFATASVTENQPMTILEAQAHGMVCIGADARGIPDLIHHNRNGLLFSPYQPEELAQALLRLYMNDELHKRLKEKTWISIQAHNLGRIAENWETQYKEVHERYLCNLYPKKDALRLRRILSCARNFTVSGKHLRKKEPA